MKFQTGPRRIVVFDIDVQVLPRDESIRQPDVESSPRFLERQFLSLPTQLIDDKAPASNPMPRLPQS
jgi:hypothetical protein